MIQVALFRRIGAFGSPGRPSRPSSMEMLAGAAAAAPAKAQALLLEHHEQPLSRMSVCALDQLERLVKTADPLLIHRKEFLRRMAARRFIMEGWSVIRRTFDPVGGIHLLQRFKVHDGRNVPLTATDQLRQQQLTLPSTIAIYAICIYSRCAADISSTHGAALR